MTASCRIAARVCTIRWLALRVFLARPRLTLASFSARKSDPTVTQMAVYQSTLFAMWPVVVLLVIIGVWLRALGMSRIGSFLVVLLCLLWIPYSVSQVNFDPTYRPETSKETIWHLYQSRHQQLAYDKLTGELLVIFGIGFVLALCLDKTMAKRMVTTSWERKGVRTLLAKESDAFYRNTSFH